LFQHIVFNRCVKSAAQQVNYAYEEEEGI